MPTTLKETKIMWTVTDDGENDYQKKTLSKLGDCYYITLEHKNIGTMFVTELEFNMHDAALEAFHAIKGFCLDSR